VVVCPVGAAKSQRVREQSELIYQELLAAGMDVALDDRDERPGAMFADWELIGVPVRITVGERSLQEGRLEILLRAGMRAESCPMSEMLGVVRSLLAASSATSAATTSL